MSTITLCNAFSLNMLTTDETIRCEKISLEKAKEILKFTESGIDNCIGHPDTDRVVQEQLRIARLPDGERKTFQFEGEMIVAQYSGPRLPEGATELPEGANIQFWHIYRVRT